MGNPIRTMIDRLYSIAIGGIISVLVNVSVFPKWAGDNLHKELVKNFHSVADSLEECVKKYLEDESEKSTIITTSTNEFSNEPTYKRCQNILNSGSKLETLAKSAKWEPPHGRFMHFSYPWSQYVKVGVVLQYCAYEVVALQSIVHAEIQVPYKLRVVFQSEIQEALNEAAELVRILGRDISCMKWSPKNSHIKRLHSSTKRLQRSMYLQYYYILTSTFEIDNPSKSFAHTYHLPDQREVVEQLECYHEITRKQLKRLYSWPSREVDAFEEDGEKSIKIVDSLESTAILSLANFTSSLVEFVARVDHLIEAVDKLSTMAKFKPADGL
ncbi:aluminum-activated malate transporter 9 [Cajanus cajan]|nr:aluminum-activated malate transporter 9 [Cajanus cajan]